MEKFQEIIFRLAETHPNAPLTPAVRTLLQDRLKHFVSRHKTPDHPPYSAMIERALHELNDKRGSREDSISQFVQKAYDNLPWAHSALLKHHLQKLCESGDIVVTRGKRYRLAGENPALNLCTQVKRKPARRKRRWDWGSERTRQRKKQFIKKRNSHKGEKVEVVEKHWQCDEKEQQLIENRLHSEDKQVKEDETERFLSCDDEENGVCGNPWFPPIELPGITRANENKYSEKVQSQQQEICPSGIIKADIRAAHTEEQQNQPDVSSPERPPGFELITVENLSQLGSTELELASAEEFFESKRTWRQARRWSRRLSEPKAANLTSAELVSSPKLEYHSLHPKHSNLGKPLDRQNIVDPTPVAVDKEHPELLKADFLEVVAPPVMNETKLKGDKKYGRRRKTKSKQSEAIATDLSMKSKQPSEHLVELYTTKDSLNLSLTLYQPELPLLNEPEPQELFQQLAPQQEDIFQGKQPRRSLRARPAKPEVAKDANFVYHCTKKCPKTVYRNRGRASKQKPSSQQALESVKAACADESKPPKCKRRGRYLTKT